MSNLDPALTMRYSAPLADFNPRGPYQAYLNRFRDPWHYLDSHGIDKVCEMLMHGFAPKEVARQLNISQGVLNKWIEADDGRRQAYEWAFENAATNEMYNARDIVDNCGLTSEEINKAGKQAEHRRHMSKGLGPKRWGSKIDVNQNLTATVSYQFNIDLSPQQKAAIEGQATRISAADAPKLLDINELIGPGLSAVNLDIGMQESMSYEEAAAQEAEESKTGEEE